MFIHISTLRILSIHSDPPLYPQHSPHTHLLCSPLHSCHWGEFLQGGRGAAPEGTHAPLSPPPQSPGLRTHLGLEKSWGGRALPWGWARWDATAGIPRIPPCRAAHLARLAAGVSSNAGVGGKGEGVGARISLWHSLARMRGMGGTETSRFWQPMSWATESGGQALLCSRSAGQASGAVANPWDTE